MSWKSIKYCVIAGGISLASFNAGEASCNFWLMQDQERAGEQTHLTSFPNPGRFYLLNEEDSQEDPSFSFGGGEDARDGIFCVVASGVASCGLIAAFTWLGIGYYF